MKTILTKSIALLAAVTMLAVSTGCGRHGQISKMTTGSSDGRHLTVVVEGRAKFAIQGKDHIVTFGGHELVVQETWLKVDGDKGLYGIPARARKVEIKVAEGVLTLVADGASLIKTPI